MAVVSARLIPARPVDDTFRYLETPESTFASRPSSWAVGVREFLEMRQPRNEDLRLKRKVADLTLGKTILSRRA